MQQSLRGLAVLKPYQRTVTCPFCNLATVTARKNYNVTSMRVGILKNMCVEGYAAEQLTTLPGQKSPALCA